MDRAPRPLNPFIPHLCAGLFDLEQGEAIVAPNHCYSPTTSAYAILRPQIQSTNTLRLRALTRKAKPAKRLCTQIHTSLDAGRLRWLVWPVLLRFETWEPAATPIPIPSAPTFRFEIIGKPGHACAGFPHTTSCVCPKASPACATVAANWLAHANWLSQPERQQPRLRSHR